MYKFLTWNVGRFITVTVLSVVNAIEDMKLCGNCTSFYVNCLYKIVD